SRFPTRHTLQGSRAVDSIRSNRIITEPGLAFISNYLSRMASPSPRPYNSRHAHRLASARSLGDSRSSRRGRHGAGLSCPPLLFRSNGLTRSDNFALDSTTGPKGDFPCL